MRQLANLRAAHAVVVPIGTTSTRAILAPLLELRNPSRRSQIPRIPARRIHSSSNLLKKSKYNREDDSKEMNKVSKKTPYLDPEEALDFTDIRNKWTDIENRYMEKLKKVTTGGSFSPSVLGQLIVKVPEADPAQAVVKKVKGAKSWTEAPPAKEFPLHELAQIIEGKGRNVIIRCHEERFAKHITSAILNSSEYNQQPQKGEDELELVMKIELRKPDEALRNVKDLANEWKKDVREQRSKKEKEIKSWRSSRMILPDLFIKVNNLLQKHQEQELGKVDKKESELLRALEKQRL